ncbi:hypothetical protein AB0H76_23390 [Nocardia sp. NPDC050712]|uniref:hypothetical protein n=1 Tax=Nocardia sp. NPDC050712 TaxID=3155518 RepID=UPI0033E2FAD8
MPDSERRATRPAAAAPSLPPEVEKVVARWNPQGAALLAAMRAGGGAATVSLIGPDDANTTLLRTELARFEPHIDLSDPMPDRGAAVEQTSPVGSVPHTIALVLLDAGNTLGTGTLDLLRRLRAEDIRILLAMNAIHAYGDWRSVHRHNQELLTAHGYDDLEILPVSAKLAAAARVTDDASLLDRSGLTALHAALTSAATGTPGDGRFAAVTARVLTDTRRRIIGQVEKLRSATEVDRWREERATLLAGRDGGRASVMAALRGQLHLARVDLMTEVGSQVRSLHVTARAELDRLRPKALGDYPEHLQHSVTELTGAVDQKIDRRLAVLVDRLDGATGLPQLRHDPAPRVGPEPEPRHRGVEDHLMVALGASAGVGLGRLLVAPLALVPALDFASIPVTLLLGALVAWWVVRARRQVADRAHVRQWVADALVNVKAQLEQRVATGLVESETELAAQVVRASAARILETDRRVAELESRIRRAGSEQPGQLAACKRDVDTLDQQLRPVDPD